MNDTERVKKIKSQLSRCSLIELASIQKYNQKRQAKLRNQAIEKSEMEHIERIKALPRGTKVIIKYGQRANEHGTLYRIGRKYVGVCLENGDRWRFPFRYVDERIDDSMVKLTAKTNKGMQGILTEVFD